MRVLSISLSVLFAVVALPMTGAAEHNDVIVVKLHEKCSLAEYVKIKDDFNATWAKDHDYRAQIAAPLQSTDLTTVFWIGRSATAAAFGAAWDAWRDAQSDSKSVAAKLQARFDKCSTNVSRSSFDVY